MKLASLLFLLISCIVIAPLQAMKRTVGTATAYGLKYDTQNHRIEPRHPQIGGNQLAIKGPDGKPVPDNQDRYVIKETKKGYFFHAVFDGTGGSKTAQHLTTLLPQYFSPSLFANNNQQLQQAVTQKFSQADIAVLRHQRTQKLDEDCSAVVCYQHNNSLIVANVGDTRAVLARLHGKNLTATQVVKDHSITTPTENTRLTQFMRSKQKEYATPRGNRTQALFTAKNMNNFDQEFNTYIDEQLSKMTFTRAFGGNWRDKVDKPHLSKNVFFAEPNVQKVTLTDNDQFLVLMSDGVYNTAAEIAFLRGDVDTKANAYANANQYVVNRIAAISFYNKITAEQVAQTLIQNLQEEHQQAYQQSRVTFDGKAKEHNSLEGYVVDDMTAVIIFFDKDKHISKSNKSTSLLTRFTQFFTSPFGVFTATLGVCCGGLWALYRYLKQ